jgi:chromosome segregation ATPase
LDPIVDAGIKDYDKKIEQENKLINKVFGARGSDVRGYGESVARRVSFAIYSLLNKQYGGKVGNLRSYIMSLEEERDHANRRYDDLMGRVIGILGDEYKELRTDSKEFIEKLTKTLGEDLKDSKIDQKALAERLADIDGLRSQINTFNKEKEQINEEYEAQTAELKSEHKEEIRNLQSQIATINKEQVQLKEKNEAQTAELKSEHKEEITNLKSQIDTLNKEQVQLKEKHEVQVADLDLKIQGLESDKNTLTNDLEQLKTDYRELKTAISTLAESVPSERMGERISEDLFNFLRKDSKVPSTVLKGIDQFIDFKKYLGLAVESGAKEVCTRIEKILGT